MIAGVIAVGSDACVGCVRFKKDASPGAVAERSVSGGVDSDEVAGDGVIVA